MESSTDMNKREFKGFTRTFAAKATSIAINDRLPGSHELGSITPSIIFYHFPTEDSLFYFVQGVAQK